MKIRQAKKIMNMMERGTDTRYFDSKYTFKKESRFIPRLKSLYQKATIRWNKANMPSANVSLFRSILRISKECGCIAGISLSNGQVSYANFSKHIKEFTATDDVIYNEKEHLVTIIDTDGCGDYIDSDSIIRIFSKEGL